MPEIFDWRGFRFHFYSYEGSPREPVHVHVAKPSADAKFWLNPNVQLARDNGMSAKELGFLKANIDERREEILEVWDELFSE